jgi:hypothetical protein
VGVESDERDAHHVRRKALEFELAAIAAVERVGVRGVEGFDVEPIRTAADLFVRREADADAAVRDIEMRHQVLGSGDDRGNAGLVVRAEQRRPRRRDDVVADLRGEIGQIRGAKDSRGIVRENDVPPVPPAMDDGLHERAGHLGRRVDVRDEPDRRDLLRGRGGDGGHQITVLVQGDV